MADSKKTRERRKFSPEFKREAVVLLRTPGITAAQASVELGVSTTLLYRWAKELERTPVAAGEGPTYQELTKELRRLRRENDFLKKYPTTSPLNNPALRDHSTMS